MGSTEFRLMLFCNKVNTTAYTWDLPSDISMYLHIFSEAVDNSVQPLVLTVEQRKYLYINTSTSPASFIPFNYIQCDILFSNGCLPILTTTSYLLCVPSFFSEVSLNSYNWSFWLFCHILATHLLLTSTISLSWVVIVLSLKRQPFTSKSKNVPDQPPKCIWRFASLILLVVNLKE